MDAGSYTDINAETIGRWVDEGWEWGTPIDHETYRRASAGDWQVLLTPTRPVPRTWFGELEGARVLGLASGGGQQCPIFAAAGAQVTVLDYTPAQLESELLVAEREGYPIACIRADMTRPLPFPDESFDLVFNPVSLCYVREVEPIWREAARVLVPGGHLMLVELTTPPHFPMKQLFHIYSHTVMPFIGRHISHDDSAYTYLPQTMAAFPQAEELKPLMLHCGFRDVQFQRFTFGLSTMYLATK